MEITISIKGVYSDGQAFSICCDSINAAIIELEMIEVNEHVFDKQEDKRI